MEKEFIKIEDVQEFLSKQDLLWTGSVCRNFKSTAEIFFKCEDFSRLKGFSKLLFTSTDDSKFSMFALIDAYSFSFLKKGFGYPQETSYEKTLDYSQAWQQFLLEKYPVQYSEFIINAYKSQISALKKGHNSLIQKIIQEKQALESKEIIATNNYNKELERLQNQIKKYETTKLTK